MSRPNSLINRLRVWLVDRIEPNPDFGEGWCMACVLNGGRTTVISSQGLRAHVIAHHEADVPEHHLSIKTRDAVSGLL